MNAQEIKNNIDRIIGTDGDLHIPSFWMNKLLNEIVDLIPDEPAEPDEPTEPTIPEESVKNDIVTFTYGTAMVRVDLTNNAILECHNNVSDAITYDTTSKSIATFYNGTYSKRLEIYEQQCIEPFYYGTSSTTLQPAEAAEYYSPVKYFLGSLVPNTNEVYVKLNDNVYKLPYFTSSRG